MQWPWLGGQVEMSLQVFAVVLAGVLVVAVGMWSVVSFIWALPKKWRKWNEQRKIKIGYNSLSKGIIAAKAGEMDVANQLAKEARRYLPDEPMVDMLQADNAVVNGDVKSAKDIYKKMLEREETKLVALHELYKYAVNENDKENVQSIALKAYELSPKVKWAAQGALTECVMGQRWQEALAIVEKSRSYALFQKHEYIRQKAVLLTAMAIENENNDWQKALRDVNVAHKLAKDLVPAAVVLARLLVRQGRQRKADKVLMTCWDSNTHPDLAQDYINNAGGAREQMKRAESLVVRGENHDALFALAKAALEAGEWEKSRRAIEKIEEIGQGHSLGYPSERVCLLMADLEEAQNNDKGRVQEWLTKAVRAKPDYVWIADTYISHQWMPCSPITHKLDAFQWRLPPVMIPDGKDNVLELDANEVDENKMIKSQSNEVTGEAGDEVGSRISDGASDKTSEATHQDSDGIGSDYYEHQEPTTLEFARAAGKTFGKSKLLNQTTGLPTHAPDDPGDNSDAGDNNDAGDGNDNSFAGTKRKKKNLFF